MPETRISFIGRTRKCANCGEKFLMSDNWVYKTSQKKAALVFCRWNCMRAWEKSRVKKPTIHKAEEIKQAIKDGLNDKEITLMLGVALSNVSYWRKKLARLAGETEEREGKQDG